MAQKFYSYKAIDKLIEAYAEKNGVYTQIEDGTLGDGFFVLHGEGLKTCVVREVPLNEWSSAHTVRFYNIMPEKYKKLIEKAEERQRIKEEKEDALCV